MQQNAQAVRVWSLQRQATCDILSASHTFDNRRNARRRLKASVNAFMLSCSARGTQTQVSGNSCNLYHESSFADFAKPWRIR